MSLLNDSFIEKKFGAGLCIKKTKFDPGVRKKKINSDAIMTLTNKEKKIEQFCTSKLERGI